MTTRITSADQHKARSDSSPFDDLYGLQMVHFGPGTAEAIVEVSQKHAQPTGVVHGGVYAAIAEAVASHGTNWTVSGEGSVGYGLSNATNFLRPVAVPARLHAVGTALHQGRTTWVWDIEIRQEGEQRVAAASRVVIAVRNQEADRA